MKITVIGAGSTYTPELVEGLLQHNCQLHIGRLCLMDIDDVKGEIILNLTRRMVAYAGQSVEVELTRDLDEALRGADFVLAQIRVGKLPARVLDEKIPLKYGLIGQETTGIGGFFNALRTVPVLYDIARRMRKQCPDAWLINFSNPSGILAEMLLNHTDVRAVGLCNVPINMAEDIREQMGLPGAEIGYLGLNHLSWVTSIRREGREYIDEAIAAEITGAKMKNITKSAFDYDVVRSIRAIPCPYLEYFYFRRAKLEKLLAEEQSRGEQCMELEKELLALYARKELVQKPAVLDERGGRRYSQAAVELICTIHGSTGEIHVVNVKNRGVIPFMDDDDVVEVPARIDGTGGTQALLAPGWDNPHIRTMMRAVKEYEKLTVRAALEGNDSLALSALLCHPLLGDFGDIKACYYEMKEAHRAYLPRFFGQPHGTAPTAV